MINKAKKIVTGLLLVLAFSPIIAMGQSTTDLQAQISVLLQRIQALQLQLDQSRNGETVRWCFSFNNNMGIGSYGGDAGSLAQALVREGLISSQTSYTNVTFDENLAGAVSSFQEKYRNDILTPVGLSAGTGYVGVRTRAKLNSLYGCSGTPTRTMPPTSAQSQLNITSLLGTSGPVGTQVTIVGNGFTGKNNKIRFGNTGSENNPIYNLNSSDGKTLIFTVPSSNYYACQYSTPACYMTSVIIQPGNYSVSVINTYGTTNTLNFTVTSGASSTNITPTISYITPASGPLGSEVAIIGSGFTPTDNVQFSDLGTYISNNYVNSSKLTFTVPSSLSNCNTAGTACTNMILTTIHAGSYNVRVVNSNGTSNSASFTVISTATY